MGGGGCLPNLPGCRPPRGRLPPPPPPVNSMTDASKTCQKMALHEINLFLYKYYIVNRMLQSAGGGGGWGCVCSGGVCVCSGGEGVSAPGGVCLGGCIPACTEADTPPPLWTDTRLWKYYLGPTSLRPVKILYDYNTGGPVVCNINVSQQK